jgi:predicted lipoprotein with Yx(FWY)xxD motif
MSTLPAPRRQGRLRLAALAAAALLTLAACGSSGTTKAASTGGSKSPTTTAATSSAAPGTTFRATTVPGLGMAVVDGRGHTIYVLSADGKTNAPCDDASGCTKVWPDLALPSGTAAATAGPGLMASLLGTMKLSSGETYPTYGGWLMYEFVGDSGVAEAHGEGLKSFGGTWYALSPAGTPITSAATTTTAPKSGVGGGGY